MKKILFVLALGAFAACGGGATTENKTDSTQTTPTEQTTPTTDSLKKDSTQAPVTTTDSTATKVEEKK